jgi:hypothetical protein
MNVVKRLSKDALIRIVSRLLTCASTEEEDETRLMTFAANCPDSVAAMKLLLEAENETAEEIVDKALTMTPRSPASYSTSELHSNHPLRYIRLE